MKLQLVLCLSLLPLACGSPRTSHPQRMATVVSETRKDVERFELRFQEVRARLAEARPTASAASEIGPQVDRLLVDVEAQLREADLHLDSALAETSHEHFVSAQEAVNKLGKGVRQLEQLAPAMGAPHTVKKP